MRIFLDEFFSRRWNKNNAFAEVEKLDGELFRKVKTRRTLKFELDGKSWFLKHHRGVGWGEILKNWCSFKRPVLGACNEYDAIRKLEELNIPTMHCGAFGEQGWNPAAMESFIITADLGENLSLEDLTKTWPVKPPERRFKTALIKRVAEISATLHKNGINHCDYYLCHFLLVNPQMADSSNFSLHLIDLHRVCIRRQIPRHYLFKDMGGLWFSAMDINLSRTDVMRFIQYYSQRSWRTELAENLPFWQKINQVAEKLYIKDFGRLPQHCFK